MSQLKIHQLRHRLHLRQHLRLRHLQQDMSKNKMQMQLLAKHFLSKFQIEKVCYSIKTVQQ
jgi:hypothetical protein